jgi:hypothetical protein
MPLFGRGSSGDQTRQPPPGQMRHPMMEGNLPCRERGCPNHNALPCNYVDRRRRRCDTAWCPIHCAVVGGFVYCRRHAGTIAAIGFIDDPLGLPDLDNRAPSLANWVARDLDGFIAAVMVQSAFPGESFVREPMVKVYNDRVRGRRFERNWKLVDHTGVRLAASVFVYEDDDATVHVKVGSGVIAEGVPPWIERRRQGLQVTDDVDRAQRAMFYSFLQEHIVAAVHQNRAIDQQYRR